MSKNVLVFIFPEVLVNIQIYGFFFSYGASAVLIIAKSVENKNATRVAGCGLRFWLADAYARSHPEGGGNGGEYGDDDVEDFTPKGFVFHDL